MKDYTTITIFKNVGCGSIYCLFLEDEGAFHKLIIKGDNAKETPCGEAGLNSMAKLLTFALRRSLWEGTTQRAVVKQLMGERCNMAIPNKEHIVSCQDAIGRCVLQYLKLRGIHEQEKQT